MHRHKHLDGTAYWKQAFQKSELAQAQLLDRVYELEQEQELNAKKLGAAQAASAVKGKRKRGADPEPMHKANSQAKRRAATNRRTFPSLDEMPSLPNLSLSKGENDSAKNAFLRHTFRLQRILYAGEARGDMLVTVFSEVCNDVFRLIHEPVHSSNARDSRTKAIAKSKTGNFNMVEIATGMETVFPSLYLAMTKERDTPSPDGHLDLMVVSLVELFHKLVREIDELFLTQALESANLEKKGTRPRPMKSRAAKTQDAARQKSQQDILELTAKLLQFMIHSLDLERDTPNELLEGYSCALLDRVGQCLSLQVFAQNIATVPTHTHPVLAQPKAFTDCDNTDIEIRQRAVEQEGPLLIRLLEQVMNLVTSRQSLMSTKSPALFGIRPKPSISRNTFADKIRLKLQNTLMQGIFGGDDTTFRNSLKMPKAAILPIHASPPGNESMPVDKPEWFIEEVWRLLGWEHLKGLGNELGC